MTQALNLSQLANNVNSSGVLAIAGGGTGSTTSTGSGSVVLQTNPIIPTIDSGTSTPLNLKSSGTTAVTIDTSQNVGIGTASPAAKLEVSSSGNTELSVTSSAGTPAITLVPSGTGVQPVFAWKTSAGAALRFGTVTSTGLAGFTEQMRLDTSGNLLVGTTSNNGVGMSLHGGATPYGYLNSSATSNTPMFFAYNGTTVGTISQNTTTTFYNVTSDKRLKDKIGFATSTDVIDNTIIYDYSWKANGLLDRGVFAQEAKLIKPIAVFEGTDELGENGLPTNPWQVDYSKYIPDLIVYCQQLKKSLEELNAKVDAQAAEIKLLTS